MTRKLVLVVASFVAAVAVAFYGLIITEAVGIPMWLRDPPVLRLLAVALVVYAIVLLTMVFVFGVGQFRQGWARARRSAPSGKRGDRGDKRRRVMAETSANPEPRGAEQMDKQSITRDKPAPAQ